MATLGVGDTAGGGPNAAALAARWARTIAGTSYVPMELPEIRAYLLTHAQRILDVWRSEPFEPEKAEPVGAALVDGHFTHPDTIARTMALLTPTLTSGDAPTADAPTADTLSRAGALLGALAAGYATRLQERTLAEQEAIRVAALTARSEAERAARVSEARFKAVFAGAAIGIGVGDTEGTILDANPALTTMLGYTVQEMRQRNVGEFMHPEDTGEVWALYEQLIRGERESFRTAKQFLRSDGRGVWTHLTVSLIRNDDGAPEFQIAVIEDVTDLRRLQNQLQFQAHHDMLTGLANRALFQLRLDHLVANPTPGKRLGVCLLDLDGFKAINDSVGHAVGDQVLIEIAGRLDAALSPKGHLVARLGGDEFVILLDGTTGAQDVIGIAEEALAAVARPVTIAGHPYSVTASAGLVERTATEADSADLVRAADITLYWAKTDGKDRWALFDSQRSDREVAQYTLARMLPAALDGDEFRLHYQPLFSLASGAPTGVEALLRWQHPWLGQIMPDRFIGAAEDIGIIVPIGGWVLHTACGQAGNWAKRFTAPLCISVNIAMRQLADPLLIDRITRVLDENDLAPTQLQLELTERAVIGSDREPLTALASLADLGVRIAIDDFGTGYSNMTYLRRLPVSELKLAASFIDELRPRGHGRDTATQIVESIVSLAHNLGLSVTAEGVETAVQADALREIGCDTAQGNYFGAPGPSDAIQRLFDAHLARTAEA